MKLHCTIARIFLLTGLSLGLAACNSTTPSPRQERIAAHATEFGQLTPVMQAQVKAGNIRDGDTFEAVYLAMGTPDHVETSADGGETLWIYKKFYQEVEVNGAPLFPRRPRGSGPAKLPTSSRTGVLRGTSTPPPDPYEVQNMRAGYGDRIRARMGPAHEPPPLPSVELEILFHGRQIVAVKITR